MVGKKFCDDVDDTILKRNEPEVVYTSRILDFGINVTKELFMASRLRVPLKKSKVRV